MTNLRPSLTITKSSRGRRPLNALALMANGPTDHDGYCRRMDRERVREWVRRNFFEQAEEVEEDKEDEEEDWMDQWKPLVYSGGGAPLENEGETEGVIIISDSSDEDEEKGEEEDEKDEGEGDLESAGMLGRAPESMNQVVPTLEPDGGIFSGLDISQEAMENYKPFADICGDCFGGIDILEE